MAAAHQGGRGLTGAIRVGSALVVIGTSVAVTALSMHQNDRVSVVVPQEQAAVTGPAPGSAQGQTAGEQIAPAAPEPRAAAVAPAGPPPPAAVRLGAGQAVPAVPSAGGARSAEPGAPSAAGPGTAVPLAPGGPAGSVPLGATPPGLGVAFDSTAATPQPPCPIGWPTPQSQGGLASLIGLAPLAGPFSSEAFALGSVYQPILRLAGPLLAEIQPVLARYQPLIDPFIAQVQAIEAVVLEAILPYYGPYRQQLINAEGELAKVLAPMLDRAYHSEAASCLVAWQGQLLGAGKGGKVAVASLAHPGAVVELGPVRR